MPAPLGAPAALCLFILSVDETRAEEARLLLGGRGEELQAPPRLAASLDVSRCRYILRV